MRGIGQRDASQQPDQHRQLRLRQLHRPDRGGHSSERGRHLGFRFLRLQQPGRLHCRCRQYRICRCGRGPLRQGADRHHPIPPAKPDTTYTVPATVAVFGDWAFEGCYNLTGIYFPGNAPTLGTDVFDHHDVTTVYYLPGTADWTSLFAGLPVVLYGEQLQITPRSIGVIADQFGFTATGPSNLQIVLEACTNLATPVWAAVSTNTFTGGSAYLSDPQWTNHAVRFYRLSLP